MTRPWIALAAPCSLLVATSALAQDLDSDLTIQPAVGQDFSRGRNVSVTEQPRPDYRPIGILIGSMQLNPGVQIGAGATSNTYLSPSDGTGSVFLYQQASARLTSAWSRHSLQLSGSTTNREFLGQARRNEHLWDVSASGRLDINRAVQIDGSVNSARRFENLFSGEVTPTVAALSQYRRDYAMLKSTYTQGRIRTFVMVDGAKFRFLPVGLRNGGSLDQSDRDRAVTRITGQVEYARSPSVAFFAQVSGTRIAYNESEALGTPRQNSKSARFLGGVNVDIAGRIRGTIGLGYTIRNYDSALYDNISGLSGEIQLETFPTQRLTFGLQARRAIEDISLGASRPSLNTRASVTVDYELLRNFIINASAGYTHQPRSGDVYRTSAGGRYLLSRRLSLDANAFYSRRLSNSVNEARIQASLSYQL